MRERDRWYGVHPDELTIVPGRYGLVLSHNNLKLGEIHGDTFVPAIDVEVVGKTTQGRPIPKNPLYCITWRQSSSGPQWILRVEKSEVAK